ncbi:MAG: hypothetical protein KAT68_00635 [Bacteroidales bacterium]|nr:hypothetical protein [Bacteroidales bacterium]
MNEIKSKVMIRLTDDGLKLVESLKISVDETSMSKSFMKAADKVVNEIPRLKNNNEALEAENKLLKEGYMLLYKVLEKKKNIEKELDEVMRDSRNLLFIDMY